MKRLLVVWIIFAALFKACNSTDRKTDLASTSRLLPEPDIFDRLKYQKQVIDTLLKHNQDKIVVLAKVAGSNPVLIKDEDFPDKVETTFNIFKDSLGHIVTVSELPFSESGDWSIMYTHYFDKAGKTFAFEKQTNFFNSICTGGIAYETQTEFYNSAFQLIAKTYTLLDEENKTLSKDSCQFPYTYEYSISARIEEFLLTNSVTFTP